MEADTSGLYSVFLREFTGTVAEATPRKVECKLHGDTQFDATTGTGGRYQVPKAWSGYSASDYSQGDNTPFKGDVQDLKVMTGMKVKLADQVRTVVSDITSTSTSSVAYFYVDMPFLSNSASEMVANTQYIFYLYPVEQLYDESTYNMLTISRAIYMPEDHTIKGWPWQLDVSVTAGAKIDASTANAAVLATPQLFVQDADTTGATPALSYAMTRVGLNVDDSSNLLYCTTACVGQGSGKFSDALLGKYFGEGTQVDISNCGANSLTLAIGYAKNDFLEVAGAIVGQVNTATATTADVKGCQIRAYDSMAKLSDGTANMKNPPLHINNRVRWITVTDQRPLKWNAPMISWAEYSHIQPSPSGISLRGVMAGGASSLTTYIDGTLIALAYGVTTLTLSGTNKPDFESYFKVRDGYTATTASQDTYLTISGCDATPGMNREFVVTAVTSATVLTISTPTMDSAVAANHPYDIDTGSSVCVGNWVTMTSRAGTLIDSKAIAEGDRVKFLEDLTTTAGSAQKKYETRTVDKIWGTGQEVTMFSVKDPFTNALDGQDGLMWVDESGQTEDAECSSRGLCNNEDGVCECFKGYTGQSCQLQNALRQ
jgi:hypothetical protein